MYRVYSLGSWFCTSVAMTLAVLVALTVPETVFADSGMTCYANCETSCYNQCGNDQTCILQRMGGCTGSCCASACNGSSSCQSTCCQEACQGDQNCINQCVGALAGQCPDGSMDGCADNRACYYGTQLSSCAPNQSKTACTCPPP